MRRITSRSRREAVELLVDLGDLTGRRAERVEDEAGEARAEDGVAVGHPTDGGEQLLGADRLRHVAPGTGADDRDDVLGGVGDGEREEADRHVGAGLDPGARSDDVGATVPVAAGQVHVEEHDVGSLLLDDLHGRLDRTGLAGDLEREGPGPRRGGEGGQLGAHAGAEHVVVVDDDDADGPRVGHEACSWGSGSGVLRGWLPAVLLGSVTGAGGSAGPPAEDASGSVGCRTGRRRTTSVPSARRRMRAVPPWRSMRPMIDSRTPARSSGTVSRSKPAPWSRTNASTASGPTSTYVLTGGLAWRTAFHVASRTALTRASRCSSIGRSPVTTSCTGTPWRSSTSPIAAVSAAPSVPARASSS